MFSNVVDEFMTFIHKYFPERQLYLRSGGEVSYHTLGTKTQLAAVTTLSLVGLWTVTTAVAMVWGNNPFKGKSEEVKFVEAKFERLLEDAEARYENAQLQLTQQQESFEIATRNFHEKHAALTQFVGQPGNQSQSTFGLNAVENGQLLMAPIVRGNYPRQARISGMESVNFDTGTNLDDPVKSLDQSQNTLLASAERSVLDRIELSRFIIESTSLDVESVLSASSIGAGGPLLPSDLSQADLGSPEIPGEARINDIKARTYEAQRLDHAVTSMPLGHPVAAENYQTSAFGRRTDPFTRRPAMHAGLDIASYRMAPIVATADGVVTFSGTKGAYGRVVEVDHGNGFTTRYAHMAKTFVKRGQKVQTGDKLGAMGSTGRSTSTHLHYEVKFQGRNMDPQNFLKAGRYVQ